MYLGSEIILVLKRVYGNRKNSRVKAIDYKHVIHSLNKKPQAYRYSQIRNELLPNEKYHSIWNYADKKMTPKVACKFIVRVLYLADKYDCEDDIASYVIEQIKENKAITLSALEGRYKKEKAILPDIIVTQHSLLEYDKMLEN